MATRRLQSLLAVAGTSFVLMLVMTPILFADSHARIVRLSDVEGDVQIDRNTGQGFERAIPNMPITQGVRLETESPGRAEIEFENGSVLRMAENSSVEFYDLSLRSDGQRVSETRVNDGTVYVNYKHKEGGEFRLIVGNQSVTLDRDTHFRLQLENGAASIAVFKGELELADQGQFIKVKRNETFTLDLGDSSQNLLAKGISNFDTDQWDSERNAYDAQYAQTYNQSQYPYQYGYSDLMSYGSFFDAPGYGMLWRPFGVSAVWDPFGAGAWAYYPSYGYMWVSGYPWGWTPYRYGTWIYVPAYGWAWQPGGWNAWNAYPVVMNPPHSWHHPQPPLAGGSRTTVIVGNPTFSRPSRTVITNLEGPTPGTAGTGTAIGRPSRGIPTSSTTNTTQPTTATTTPTRPSLGQQATPNQNAVNQPMTKTPTEMSRPSRTTNMNSAPPTKSEIDRPSRQMTPPAPAPRPAPAPSPAPRPSPSPAPMSRPSTPKSSMMSSPSMGSSGGTSHASTSAGRPSRH